MACNTSAVLDVVVENKEHPSFARDSRDFDLSSVASLDNSLLQPPSLDSFTSVQDLSELKIGDNSDLSVTVDNPQKVLDTLETYITFRLTTKTVRIEFPENEYIVRRRYNDFVWLRQKLVECHPFCIVPPLPAKHSLVGQLDRYSRDFVLVRMKALNTFIKRIVQHPILSCNEHFKAFITAKQGQFNLHRKQKSNTDCRIRSVNSTMNRATAKNGHLEFDRIKTSLHCLHENLSLIEKISSRMNKEKHNLVNELNNLHPVFSSWASLDTQFSGVLCNIGKAIETSSKAENSLAFDYPVILVHPIKELLAYIDVVQEALKKREMCQQTYQTSLSELNRRQNEKEKLLTGSATGFSFWKQPTNDDRLSKLTLYIPQLVKKVEANQDNLECANECLRSDLEQWQKEKDGIIKKMLQDYVAKQVEYHISCANAWQQAMKDFDVSSQTLRK